MNVDAETPPGSNSPSDRGHTAEQLSRGGMSLEGESRGAAKLMTPMSLQSRDGGGSLGYPGKNSSATTLYPLSPSDTVGRDRLSSRESDGSLEYSSFRCTVGADRSASAQASTRVFRMFLV